jgi:hypothetical protein
MKNQKINPSRPFMPLGEKHPVCIRQTVRRYGGIVQKPEKNNGVHGEWLAGQVVTRMQSWRMPFEDAQESALIYDRGVAVYRGHYTSGPYLGQPAAPTVRMKEF